MTVMETSWTSDPTRFNRVHHLWGIALPVAIPVLLWRIQKRWYHIERSLSRQNIVLQDVVE